MVAAQDTIAAVRRVLDALDYAALGELYCDHGGEAFWAARRAAVLDLGLLWAAELVRRLPRGGASLYVGAGVAEVPSMVVEALDLGRRVVACNLRAAECATVNRALAAQSIAVQVRADDARLVDGAFDHVSLVSVLCDPESFPIVSDVTYGRVHPVQLDAAALAAEQQRVRALADAVLGRLRLPGWVTTTVEETPWVLEWAERHAARAISDDVMVETAVVGDPIGFLQLVRAADS